MTMGKQWQAGTTTYQTEPLVVLELGFSYNELCSLTQAASQAKRIELPSEIIYKIASFFIVEPVNSSSVKVVRASSSNGQHPLSAALDPSLENWWFSRTGTMLYGKGREYVEFQLSNKLCRLQRFSIKTPPLREEAVGVRQLRLEKYQAQDDQWIPISPIWTTEGQMEWQTYTLDPPVDVQMVRVVCLSNQFSKLVEQMEDGQQALLDLMYFHMWSAGFFCVKFE